MAMRLYWYWPFLRSEDIGLAEAVADERVEHLLVHTLDRPGVPRASGNPRVELRNDLPEVTPARVGSTRWLADRSRTYVSRRRRRSAQIGAGPDLTHIWFLNPFTDALDIPRFAAAGPLVVNVHDIRPHNPRLPRPVGERLLGRIYRSGAHLVVHHRELRDRLCREFGADPGLVHVVPHAVRHHRRPDAAPARHGDRVLCFGTLRHNKGIDVLLDAIDRSDPSIHWEILGRGEPALERAVESMARRRPSLTARIGHVDEKAKAEAFDRADLVVLPYTSFESQSGVLHDAYAHGVPVVVTDVGALGTTVREDGTGRVVPAGDADALLESVTALLADHAARTELATATEAMAAARSPRRVAELLHELYAAVTAVD